jgi:hypothetical protein
VAEYYDSCLVLVQMRHENVAVPVGAKVTINTASTRGHFIFPILFNIFEDIHNKNNLFQLMKHINVDILIDKHFFNLIYHVCYYTFIKYGLQIK